MSETSTISKVIDRAIGTDEFPVSAMGTAIVNPILFVGGPYNVFNEKGEVVNKSFNTFRLPGTTIVQFRRAKIVTKTKSLASKSTVKELYGFEDWRIDITGRCTDDQAHPQAKTMTEQLRLLLEFEAIADAIGVIGIPFEERNISELVIEGIETNQPKGKPGVIDFKLQGVSDNSFDLITLS